MSSNEKKYLFSFFVLEYLQFVHSSIEFIEPSKYFFVNGKLGSSLFNSLLLTAGEIELTRKEVINSVLELLILVLFSSLSFTLFFDIKIKSSSIS